MMRKISNAAILMLLALAASAQAAETSSACKLKGGSVVPLPAETCAKEGGVMVTVTIAAPAPAAAAPAPAEPLQLSSDPKRAAAQRAIVELLDKPLISTAPSKNGPESIGRRAKFAECTLTVEEDMHVDHGNLLAVRKDFKISSMVDFRLMQPGDYGIMGKTSSKGGSLEAYSIYLEKPSRRGGKDFSISISLRHGDKYWKYKLSNLSAYWDAPRDDFWMADDYGYPKADDMGNILSNKIRILYIVATPDDAAALKKAFDEMHAACGQ